MQHIRNIGRDNFRMTAQTIQKNYIKTALRLPRGLHSEIQDAAERNGRSMNAEIIDRLQSHPIGDRLSEISKSGDEIKAIAREILDIVSSR